MSNKEKEKYAIIGLVVLIAIGGLVLYPKKNLHTPKSFISDSINKKTNETK